MTAGWRLWIVRLCIGVGLGAAAGAVAGVARAQIGVQAQTEVPDADPGLFGNRYRFTEATGPALYRHVCAGCHMVDGGGAVGAGVYPSLVQDKRLAGAAYPIDIVLHGRGAMPAFQRLLSDQQVAAVVAYVRQSFGNAYADAPSAEDVHAAR